MNVDKDICKPFLMSPDLQELSYPEPQVGIPCRNIERVWGVWGKVTCRQSAAALLQPTDVPTEGEN